MLLKLFGWWETSGKKLEAPIEKTKKEKKNPNVEWVWDGGLTAELS